MFPSRSASSALPRDRNLHPVYTFSASRSWPPEQLEERTRVVRCFLHSIGIEKATRQAVLR